MDGEGRLQGGTIPLLFTFGVACQEGFGDSVIMPGRTVGCGSSLGGLFLISPSGSGDQPFSKVQQEEINHDGSKLSGISSGVKVGKNKLVMGSPYSLGVLMCEI